MAETWSVTPTEGAENLGGGKFKFTPPESGSRNYTITYTNGTQSASTIFPVSSRDCVVCDCTKIKLTDKITSVTHTGTTANTKVATINLTGRCEDYTGITISGSVEGVFSLPNDNKSVLATIPPNTTTASISYSYVLIYGDKRCDGTLTTITQDKIPCDCNSIIHTPVPTVETFDGNGFTGTVATYSVSTGCDITKVGIQGDTNVYILTTEGSTHIVKASVDANTGRYTRSFSYELTYNDDPCDGKGRTITQDIACNCDKFQFVAEEGGSIYIPASGGCEISLGKITGSTENCQYTYQSCTISESTFGNNELYIDDYDSEKGLIGSIQQNNGNPSTVKIKSAKLTVSAKDSAGDICTAKPFYLKQYASMTDNDSAMQNNDCAVHALKIDSVGTGGGNDEIYILGNDQNINWRDYFEYKANTPFEGQSVAPTGVKDQQGDIIGSFDTTAINSINEPYFADGVWHLRFDLSAHSGTKRYAVIYLHNKKFGTEGNKYQEYGWIIAGQPMRN